LALDCGYVLTDNESRLLERIQEFVVWTARYPIPIDSEAMRPRTTPEGGFAPRTYHQLGADWTPIRSLLFRFKNDLTRIRAQ
jgi:hypothetical protein